MKIQFLHESIGHFLASGRLNDAGMAGQLHVEDHVAPAWEEAMVFTAEQYDCVEPLITTLCNGLAETYSRRRVAELLARVGRPQDVDRILAALSGDDQYLYVLVGFALRSVLAQPGAESYGRRVMSRLREWTQPTAQLEDKLQAARVIDRLGLMLGPEAVDLSFAVLSDSAPLVRAAHLIALAECALSLARLTGFWFDDDQTVRSMAVAAVFSQLYRNRSPQVSDDLSLLVEQFSKQYQEPPDQYALTYWIGKRGARRSDTEHLISVLGDTTQHEAVHVTAVRYLCRYPHRSHMIASDWRNLHTFTLSPLAKQTLEEAWILNSLFDDQETASVSDSRELIGQVAAQNETHMAFEPGEQSVALGDVHLDSDACEAWENWRSAHKSMAELLPYFEGQTWAQVRTASRILQLPPDQWNELIRSLEWKLMSGHEQESQEVAEFLLDVGPPDARLLSLRLKAMCHRSPQIRNYGVWQFDYHHLAAPLLLHLTYEDPDAYVRADAAVALLLLVGAAALPIAFERMEGDPSSLVRGYITVNLRFFPGRQDVRQALLRVVSTDPDPWVRARAMRAYERVGNSEGLQTLQNRFEDYSVSKSGRVCDVARQVHDAIMQYPSAEF